MNKKTDCPYLKIWSFENINTLICVVDEQATACDWENYTKCSKFLDTRKQFYSY